MLITMLLTLGVFSAGYIAAYNDWAAFAKVILDFSNFEHKVNIVVVNLFLDGICGLFGFYADKLRCDNSDPGNFLCRSSREEFLTPIHSQSNSKSLASCGQSELQTRTRTQRIMASRLQKSFHTMNDFNV